MRNAKSLSRQERRALMPETSRFVDACQSEFGPVHVVYATEGGCEWNSPDMAKVTKAVCLTDMECWDDVGRRSVSLGHSNLRSGVGRRKVGNR